ncbi:MAG: pyrimidine utilization protein A [Hyphomicrobiaceae bacterium]|nr:pyrimidine utilization protein A [Hyphomicrobiaceae bacterium]
MKLGVFIPIGNNGWLMSTTSPQYMPSFALNREVVTRAERYGFDFALSMVKLRGFGGASQFWDYNLESFTLMAGLASVTSRIRLYASVPVLALPPALVARMAVTIDSISNGRFGVNIVSGWAKAEYEQMGLWPGEVHFARRYDYSTEYVTILRELLDTGRSNFKGDYFQMSDCHLAPLPSRRIELVCAGQSARGMRFAAECGDYNFFVGSGVNTPKAHARFNEELVQAAEKAGRDVGAYSLFMVIADETAEAARAKWARYAAGFDAEAHANLSAQAELDKSATARSNAKTMASPERAVNLNMGTLIGSYGEIAQMLDEAAEVPGTKGIMLTFDEFVDGIEAFGRRIQPLMRSRQAELAALA